MAWSRPPLTRLAVIAAALLLAGVAAGFAVRSRDGAPQDQIGASAYRIAYDVEDLVSGVRTKEVLEVDRPRVSRRLLDGGGSATTDAGVYDRSATGEWRQIAVVAPGEPGQDLQLAAPLMWAEREGLARRDGPGSPGRRHVCSSHSFRRGAQLRR